MAVAQRETFRSPYFRVLVDDGDAIVRIIRSSEPFQNLTVVRSAWLAVIEALDRSGRANRCLLSDLREAPARNDPEFEKVVTPLIPRALAGYRRNAILVRLAVGALQLRRHTKADGIERLITSSEEEALRYLMEVL